VHAIEEHLDGSMVSSSSSSESGQDIWNLIHERREAGKLYSEATLEVGQLEQCLNAVKTTLFASKEETNVTQMRADEAHARAAGKISLKSLCFYIHDFIR
jgi:hypothetical protein